MRRKALFLDRDGVINEDYGYVHEKENFKFKENIFSFTKFASERGFIVIVVTNQAGIGRGYYSDEKFLSLNNWMINEFLKRNIVIQETFYCATHPEYGIGEYKKKDYRRKPFPGMLFEACDKYEINMGESILVGDKISDVRAGLSAGVGLNLLFDHRKNMKIFNQFIRIPSLETEYLLMSMENS